MRKLLVSDKKFKSERTAESIVTSTLKLNWATTPLLKLRLQYGSFEIKTLENVS